jgi:hypothetical protein
VKSFLQLLLELDPKEYAPTYKRRIIDRFKDHPDRDKLYVRFSHRKEEANYMSKAPSWNPNHADPIGIYAYPFDFFFEKSGEVPYLSDAPILRVLKDVSKNKLLFSTVDDKMMGKIISKIIKMEYPTIYKFIPLEFFIDRIKREFRERVRPQSKNWQGRVVFQAMQFALNLDFFYPKTAEEKKI